MMEQVIQLMSKSRPRNCIPSNFFEGRLEMFQCPKKSLSTLPRMPLSKKYWMNSVALLPSHAYALVINVETESGFITEHHTPSIGHSPSCHRSEKIQSALPVMWGQW
ncbi:hypothetical protein TNCV_2493591 [Trichonephila clavipes]|uniref:Uncharacterized protein n=1 Tax=Trichonephila clavipes TaxID=2585209 RepID=A0A8X6V4N8_TRICX|nr:hypothetical protein TNCV_2493591 [Trichonephila clavipes]